MRKGKSILAVLLAVVMCFGLSACGKEFDAAGYTRSVLDANYKGNFEEYAKFRRISTDEAKTEVADGKEQIARQQLTQMGILGDEFLETYLNEVAEIERLAKYTVKGAEEQKDGSYIVTVEVEPATVYTDLTQHSAEVAQEIINAGKNVDDTAVFMEILTESIHRSVAGNTYGTVQEIEVKITKNADDVYGIEQSDMTKLEEALFPQAS